MKFSHNKKRNTGFIYEILIRELSKATMREELQKKNNILSILKTYFAKGKPLKEDLEIYNSFINIKDLSRATIEKILTEAKKQFLKLDAKRIYQEQTKLINNINKSLGQKIWENFIPNYKNLATINQILQQKLNPQKQIIFENKLIDNLSSSDEEKTAFPKINNLAMKTFIEKFNNQYSDTLNEEQKEFLNKYIISHTGDNLEFKLYIYEEVDKLKKFLEENKSGYNEHIPEKIDKVLNRISTYKNKKLDKTLIFEILRIQTLVSELKNNALKN